VSGKGHGNHIWKIENTEELGLVLTHAELAAVMLGCGEWLPGRC